MAKSKTFQYRMVGNHVEDLLDGQTAGPGDFVDLTEDQLREPLIERLIADDKLIPVDDPAEHEAKLADRRVASQEKKEGGE